MRYLIFIWLALVSNISIAQQDSTKAVFVQLAEYPGGNYAMQKFLLENLKCPKEAIKAGVNERAYVKIEIDSTGKVIDAYLNRKYGFGIDEEIIRVVKLMPNWKPAMRGGKNVNTTMQILVRVECKD